MVQFEDTGNRSCGNVRDLVRRGSNYSICQRQYIICKPITVYLPSYARRVDPKHFQGYMSRKKSRSRIVPLVDESWIVEEIVAHKHHRPRGRFEFRVRWKSFPPDQDTWEPITHFSPEAQGYDLLLEYLREQNISLAAVKAADKDYVSPAESTSDSSDSSDIDLYLPSSTYLHHRLLRAYRIPTNAPLHPRISPPHSSPARTAAIARHGTPHTDELARRLRSTHRNDNYRVHQHL